MLFYNALALERLAFGQRADHRESGQSGRPAQMHSPLLFEGGTRQRKADKPVRRLGHPQETVAEALAEDQDQNNRYRKGKRRGVKPGGQTD